MTALHYRTNSLANFHVTHSDFCTWRPRGSDRFCTHCAVSAAWQPPGCIFVRRPPDRARSDVWSNQAIRFQDSGPCPEQSNLTSKWGFKLDSSRTFWMLACHERLEVIAPATWRVVWLCIVRKEACWRWHKVTGMLKSGWQYVETILWLVDMLSTTWDLFHNLNSLSYNNWH